MLTQNQRTGMMAATTIVTAFVLLLASAEISGAKSDSSADLIHFKTCRDSHNKHCKQAMDDNPETCYHSISILPGIISPSQGVWWEGDLGKQASVEKVLFSNDGSFMSEVLDMFRNYEVTLDNDYKCSHLGESSDYKYNFRCDDKVTRKVKVAPGWNFYMRFCEVAVQGRRYGCKNHDVYTLDEVSGKCYSKPSSNLMTYSEAKEMCEKKGGRLPVLKTDEDMSYFETRVPDTKDMNTWKGYWLGGIQLVRGKPDFAWDGETEAMQKTNWQRGEPNFLNTEDAIFAMASPRGKNNKGKWINARNSGKYYVTCQEV